jgi:hypothetical protein
MGRDSEAIVLLEAFARRTGLVDGRESRRYLWTDAIALCTYLALYRRRRDSVLLRRARTLLSQVHGVLGHHAVGPRRGHPLGDVDEASWQQHPTLHGLRIGSRCRSVTFTSRSMSASNGSETASTSTTSRAGCTRSSILPRSGPTARPTGGPSTCAGPLSPSSYTIPAANPTGWSGSFPWTSIGCWCPPWAAADLPDLRAFWLDPAHQKLASWSEHEDINAVTLAASLVGEDYDHAAL